MWILSENFDLWRFVRIGNLKRLQVQCGYLVCLYFLVRSCAASSRRLFWSLFNCAARILIRLPELTAYIDHLLDRRLQPKTINCHLNSIRRFYSYLHYEEQIVLSNPVKRGCKLRLSRPLTSHLRDQDESHFFSVIKNCRDRAMSMLMLRCGLRVEEVATLSLAAVDWRHSHLYVYGGKGQKDRMVYISHDTYDALVALNILVKMFFPGGKMIWNFNAQRLLLINLYSVASIL